jgi:uncharacterized protein (DUF2141 family)
MSNPLVSALFSAVYSSTHSKLSLKRARWCTATAIGIACMGAVCMPTTAADLTVKVEGIRETRGTIRLELDGSAAAWDNKEKPTALGSTPAVIGAVTYTFKGLPRGSYAVGVYHDANDNGELDMNFLGIPKEDFGISNDPNLTRKPTFEEAHVDVGDADQHITIHLVHLI